ncbi:MAG: hypothetical protein H0U89_10595, partial [Acidimicrobiia bacterium]|nr:hypothetical protein [Acidimicrobiia bacterium]
MTSADQIPTVGAFLPSSRQSEARRHADRDRQREADGRARSEASWPVLDPAARYGLAGKVVELIEPHSEADPAALLVDFLVAVGSAIGPGPHALAEAAQHPARLYAVLVGETSRGRKGSARSQIQRVMRAADPGWSDNGQGGGLASGEGVIASVADGEEPVEKRRMFYEPEFARVLGVAAREGSTLSAVLRDAWDSGTLRVTTRKEKLVATGAHVSVMAHITVEELRRRLPDTEIANGYANRFLFACVK